MVSIYAIWTQKDIYVLSHSVYSCSFCLCFKVLWCLFVSVIIQLIAAVHLHHFWFGIKNCRLLFLFLLVYVDVVSFSVNSINGPGSVF